MPASAAGNPPERFPPYSSLMTTRHLQKAVRIHKASFLLQVKVGSGSITERTIERCQAVIDNNDFDFTVMAGAHLDRLEMALAVAKQEPGDQFPVIRDMILPVMELKANASIFRYGLIGALANVMLGFLEAVKTLDEDIIEIVEAHHRILEVVVSKKMAGDGGQTGARMKEELENACTRYFLKRSR